MEEKVELNKKLPRKKPNSKSKKKLIHNVLKK